MDIAGEFGPWEGYQYVPRGQPQWCQGTDLTVGYNGRRTSCDQQAEHFVGTYYFLGFCPTHWIRFREILTDELRSADGLDHWLLAATVDRGGRILAQEAAERQQAADAEDRQRRRLQPITAPDRRGTVYFIQAGEAGPIKIGTTRKLAQRLADLQVASPYRLHLRATQAGDATVERRYHQRFAEDRIGGEWFEPVPDLLALIAEVAASR